MIEMTWLALVSVLMFSFSKLWFLSGLLEQAKAELRVARTSIDGMKTVIAAYRSKERDRLEAQDPVLKLTSAGAEKRLG